MHTSENSQKPLVSGIATFHNEGIAAHRTMLGLDRLRKYSEQRGITVELVAVLDSADNETTRIVSSSPVMSKEDTVVEVRHKDVGLSRNSGVQHAAGEYIGVFDGDDYYSANWLVEALRIVEQKKHEVAVHPEYQISFEKVHCIARPPDMDEEQNYPLATCLAIHPWTSCAFARRSTFLAHPYQSTKSRQTGYGFEDWHWNLELIADGIRHVSAPGTAHFYRRKQSSMLSAETIDGAVIRPSCFFDPDTPWINQLFRKS